MSDDFNVLISSAGRRVQLMDGFRSALNSCSLKGRIVAIDASRESAAFQLADEAFLVPRVNDPDFVETVAEICRSRSISLVVPTIDTELACYADAKPSFRASETTVAVSDSATISIANDKRRTHGWMREQGIPTVEQVTAADLLFGTVAIGYPAIAKPATGSMSQGVRVIDSLDDLLGCDTDELIVQTIAQGDEYTVSVLVDLTGDCLAAVPRKRLEVRAGEVSKGVTVHQPELERVAARVAESLPGAYGALNVQAFFDEGSGDVRVIEINARFGGGDPLAWAAGADFPTWMVADLSGREIEHREWLPGTTMLRFDRAVYVHADGSLGVG